jgi:hypothetical protein
LGMKLFVNFLQFDNEYNYLFKKKERGGRHEI